MAALALSGKTDNLSLVFVCSFCLAVWVQWGGLGLADLQIGVCLTLFCRNTLCKPRHAPLLGIRGKKTKGLGPKFGFISMCNGCLLHLQKAVATPRPDHWYYLVNPSSFADELMSNASLLQAGYEHWGTAECQWIIHYCHPVNLLAQLKHSFGTKIIIGASVGSLMPIWESLQLMVLFLLFHPGLQSWGNLSRKMAAELVSIRKWNTRKYFKK